MTRQSESLVDAALNSLIDLFQGCAGVPTGSSPRLAGEIHDPVLDPFLGETLQELDELSTHKLFVYHQTEDMQATSIDDKLIHLKVSGTVYVDLQYGSSSDKRDDMGAVISYSYPYTAPPTVKSSLTARDHQGCRRRFGR